MKLGAYYWDGWYAKNGAWTERLLNEFPDREPVWGWLGNTVENMEMQVDLAADGGLKFFAYDWYYPQRGKVSEMNDAVDRYLNCKNAGRMEFCLLVANHDGGYIYRENWEDACRRFMPYLTNEHALKTSDGRPVILFFDIRSLHSCLGDVAECKKCIDYLREECKKEGLPGVCVVGCGGPPRDENGDIPLEHPQWTEWYPKGGFCEALGLDALTGYNHHRQIKVRGGEKMYIYPYEELAKDHEQVWDLISGNDRLPYMPCVIGGWDCRPWENLDKPESRSCYSPDRTPQQIYKHVKNAGEWLKNNQEKALSDLAIVYAWNENGEGGIIEPTRGDEGRFLAAVKKACDEYPS
jgi:hypothetical protein